MRKLLLILPLMLLLSCKETKYEKSIEQYLTKNSSYEDIEYKSTSIEIINYSSDEFKKVLNDSLNSLYENGFGLKSGVTNEDLKRNKAILKAYLNDFAYVYAMAGQMDIIPNYINKIDSALNCKDPDFKSIDFMQFYALTCKQVYLMAVSWTGIKDISLISKTSEKLSKIKDITAEISNLPKPVRNFRTIIENKYTIHDATIGARTKHIANAIFNSLDEIILFETYIDNNSEQESIPMIN